MLTTNERAAGLPNRPIRMLAAGQMHDYNPDDVVPVTFGWADFSQEMYEVAGLGPQDVDVVELYDDYPIMEVIQLEDLGFCSKGDGGPFVQRTDISVQGTLPINTGGGILSAGQAGNGAGILAPVEAVRQLRGEGGRRQVSAARIALVTGLGTVSYGHILSSAAMLLSA